MGCYNICMIFFNYIEDVHRLLEFCASILTLTCETICDILVFLLYHSTMFHLFCFFFSFFHDPYVLLSLSPSLCNSSNLNSKSTQHQLTPTLPSLIIDLILSSPQLRLSLNTTSSDFAHHSSCSVLSSCLLFYTLSAPINTDLSDNSLVPF
ncbi:hypothetical protein Pst134EA_027988 [Puccinia striiformis f. sp. tritici]|nr:hypothetical protein Pst134EA_027988 [Puccinia striiformis f. sp. tritici]KAH9448694.1 hypothetical protein Pst134EA_027988 [Puccinia striiformis f. sp. tritici]